MRGGVWLALNIYGTRDLRAWPSIIPRTHALCRGAARTTPSSYSHSRRADHHCARKSLAYARTSLHLPPGGRAFACLAWFFCFVGDARWCPLYHAFTFAVAWQKLFVFLFGTAFACCHSSLFGFGSGNIFAFAHLLLHATTTTTPFTPPGSGWTDRTVDSWTGQTG